MNDTSFSLKSCLFSSLKIFSIQFLPDQAKAYNLGKNRINRKVRKKIFWLGKENKGI